MTSTRTWDHSALKDLICEEKFTRRHVQHLAAPESSAAQAFGTAVHAGVRAYYDGATDHDIAHATERGYGAANADDSDFRTVGLALDYVDGYMRAWPRPWGFQVLWNEGFIAGAEFNGIPDRAVKRDLDGLIYPFDLKTTSLWIGAAWQDQWQHSQQAAMQIELIEQKLAQPVAGFWMDAVYVSSRKGGPKRDDFVRCGPFTYSAAKRAELLAQVVRDSVRANELLAGAPPLMTGPRNGACLAYGKRCQFARFCNLDPSDRADAYNLARATGELVEQPWEPENRG